MNTREQRGLLALILRLRECAPHVLRGVGHRRELVLLELQESVRKAALLVMAGAAGVFALGLAAVSTTILVAAIYWDTPQRVFALAVVVIGEAVAGLGLLTWLWSSWRRWRFLQATLEQIEKDSECLARIFQKTES